MDTRFVIGGAGWVVSCWVDDDVQLTCREKSSSIAEAKRILFIMALRLLMSQDKHGNKRIIV